VEFVIKALFNAKIMEFLSKILNRISVNALVIILFMEIYANIPLYALLKI
jgi:hypothetical protein